MMKIRTIISILVVVVFCTSINIFTANAMTPPQFVGWDFTSSTQNWTASDSMSSPTQSGGSLTATISGNLASVISPSGQQIPSIPVRTAEFRLKLPAGSYAVKLLWRSENSGWSEKNSATININTNDDYHDYQMDLFTKSGWANSGTVVQLKLSISGTTTGTFYMDNFRLTGVYYAPFMWVNGVLNDDIALYQGMKDRFQSPQNTSVIAAGGLVEVLSLTDANGDWQHNKNGTIFNPDYYVTLAEATGVPAILWLRNDPWGYSANGVYGDLYNNNNNVMWTQDMDNTRFYRSNTGGGHGYLSLAEKDLSGQKTAVWVQKEKLLGQAAAHIAQLIKDHPGTILGVTNTSEYLMYSEISGKYLDYNPNTIQEFRDFCQAKWNSNLAQFQTDMGLSGMTTWALKSTTYNPAVINNSTGFDAPRNSSNSVFWKEWTLFLSNQVKNAVQHEVDILKQYLDKKYIYTHQIIADDLDVSLKSPTWTSNVRDVNVGNDMLADQTTLSNSLKVASYVSTDVSRTWGVPEWIPDGSSYSSTLNQLHALESGGVKFIGPLAYGTGGAYEIKDTPVQQASIQYLNERDSYVNKLSSKPATVSSGISGWEASKLTDQGSGTWSSLNRSAAANTESARVDMGSITKINKIVITPRAGGLGFPVNYTIETSADNSTNPTNWSNVATQTGQSNITTPQTFTFSDRSVRHVRVTGTLLSYIPGDSYRMQLNEMSAFYDLPSGTAPSTAPVLSTPIDLSTGVSLTPTFSWSAVSGTNVKYHLQISTSSNFSSPIDYTGLTTTSFTPSTGLAQGTTYYYRVYAVNSYGVTVQNGKSFATASFTPASRTGSGASSFLSTWESGKSMDSNLSTSWSSQGHASEAFTESIYVDFGTSSNFKVIRVVPRSGGNGYSQSFPKDFSIQWSNSSSGPWTTISGQSYTDFAKPENREISFVFNSAVNSRYLRINATKLSQDEIGSGYYFQVAEINADY